MNPIRRTVLSLAGAALATGLGAGTALAADVTLRLHEFLPAQAGIPKHIMGVWAQNVSEATGGRVEIQSFPSMQLGGKPPELYDQVKDGVVDLTWTVIGYTPGRFPRAEVFELPFMLTNAADTSRAFWDIAEKYMIGEAFDDVKVLAVWVHGPGLIHSTDPVESPADLNGVKLRAPTRIINKLFSDLGATTVGMPVPAIPEALSKGVIDATVIPWEVTGALKTSEMVENHTEFGDAALYTTTFVFAMNKAVWDGLAPDLQEAIMSVSGPDFSAFAGGTMEDLDGPGRTIAEDLGNNIIMLSDDQVAEWRAASQATTDAWVAEMNEKGLDGSGLLEEARMLIDKYTGMN
ncbi:MAG: TRAP transporter substrate-binding protein [Rhodobacter sp.]|nr:TRAP transporter substrate-binding protein [Rhodobacter sp.]